MGQVTAQVACAIHSSLVKAAVPPTAHIHNDYCNYCVPIITDTNSNNNEQGSRKLVSLTHYFLFALFVLMCVIIVYSILFLLYSTVHSFAYCL